MTANDGFQWNNEKELQAWLAKQPPVEEIERVVRDLDAWLAGPFAAGREHAARLAEELAEATGDMTADLASAEEALSKRWPGRAAAIEIDADHTLVLAPWDGRTRLLVIKGGHKYIQPLVNMARHIRITASGLLRVLADQLQYEDEV